jgi:hypothetical protein
MVCAGVGIPASSNAEESMAKGFIHTVYNGERWINEVEGGAAIRGGFPTKAVSRRRPSAAPPPRRSANGGQGYLRNTDPSLIDEGAVGVSPVRRTVVSIVLS